ncbi:MFS transporter [Antrihabitans sp. YC2-6]|uniref:MFS transporter n=1 Tax=Antrihabitans sp. YC2-6 TaxID=2799498 RepID=UPI0018F7AB73|nr:MFS transporter [Antrihabitans sp. YC2-6]
MTSTITLSKGTDVSSGSGDDLQWPLRLWGMLITLCLVLFLDGLDVSMVGVAVPSIGADLGLSTSTLQWLISGYVLGYGGLLLLGGRTADLAGRRKVFLIAVAVFAIASLAGGLVDSGPLLIATRLIKGVAAAFTAPTGLSIITTTFAEGKARNKALALYTVFGASGFSFGLVFGGLMTGINWRYTFMLPVPIALIALVAGYFLIPRDKPSEAGSYDLVGATLLTASMLLLVFTVVSAPEAGWGSVRTIGSFVAVAALLAAFVRVEQRIAHPLVRLGMLRRPTLLRAAAAIVAMGGSFITFQFMVTLYLQDTLGWSPIHMAVALLPTGIIVVLSSTIMGGVIDRFGTQPLIAAGLLSMSLGYLLFLRMNDHPDYWTQILPTVLLLGAGFALGFSAINVQATNGVADHEQGLAAGLVQTAMQVGPAVVLAVATAMIGTTGSAENVQTAAEVLDGYRPALIFVMFVALAGLLTTVNFRRRPKLAPAMG